MIDVAPNITGNLQEDVLAYSKEVKILLNERRTFSLMNIWDDLKRHINGESSIFDRIAPLRGTDIPGFIIDGTAHFIYRNDAIDREWSIWNKENGLEAVLFPDWNYKDLVGAIALLRQGALARVWNRQVLDEDSMNKLGHNKLEFKIKKIRQRDPKLLFQ